MWELDVEIVPHKEAQQISKKILHQKRDESGEGRAGAALNPFGGQAVRP